MDLSNLNLKGLIDPYRKAPQFKCSELPTLNPQSPKPPNPTP